MGPKGEDRTEKTVEQQNSTDVDLNESFTGQAATSEVETIKPDFKQNAAEVQDPVFQSLGDLQMDESRPHVLKFRAEEAGPVLVQEAPYSAKIHAFSEIDINTPELRLRFHELLDEIPKNAYGEDPALVKELLDFYRDHSDFNMRKHAIDTVNRICPEGTELGDFLKEQINAFVKHQLSQPELYFAEEKQVNTLLRLAS